MIRQDDKRYTNQFIIDEGCAYHSLLFYVNKYTNEPLDPLTIEAHFERMKREGCFTDDNLIIWVKAFKYFGMNVEYYKNIEEDMNFCIYNWHNPATGYYHFTAGANGICTFDPLGESVTVSHGHIHSIRGFKIKGII